MITGAILSGEESIKVEYVYPYGYQPKAYAHTRTQNFIIVGSVLVALGIIVGVWPSDGKDENSPDKKMDLSYETSNSVQLDVIESDKLGVGVGISYLY